MTNPTSEWARPSIPELADGYQPTRWEDRREVFFPPLAERLNDPDLARQLMNYGIGEPQQ